MKKDWKDFCVFLAVVVPFAMLLSRLTEAQTTPAHSVTLNYAGAGNADVYRAAAGCDAPVAFVKVATNVAPPYVDTQVNAGAQYCYFLLINPTNIPVGFLEAQIPIVGTATVKAIPMTVTAVVQ